MNILYTFRLADNRSFEFRVSDQPGGTASESEEHDSGGGFTVIAGPENGNE